MRAFEIHTYRESKWKMDSVFDDRELAMYEAKKIAEGSRFSGVKVIEENYNEVTNLTTTRTLYRGGAARTEPKRKSVERTPQARRASGGGPGAARKRGARPAKKKTKTNLLVPVLLLFVLILGGVVVLFGLQHFSALQ